MVVCDVSQYRASLFQGPPDGGVLKRGVSEFGRVHPDLCFLCPFFLGWDFPLFSADKNPDLFGDFPDVSFSAFSAY